MFSSKNENSDYYSPEEAAFTLKQKKLDKIASLKQNQGVKLIICIVN